MTSLAIVSSDTSSTTLATIETLDLDLVTGGYDFSAALKAGNAAAPAGREAGQTLGTAADAGVQLFTGKSSTVGSAVGGPIGAAAGFAGGFATNTYQQLTGKH